MKITTTRSQGFEVGEILQTESLDRRKWKRLLYWLLRRPPPRIRKMYRITDVTNSTSLEVRENKTLRF